MDDVSIVVPCYNEADRLDRQAFHQFLEQHPRFHFVFVNDGSRDATLTVLEAIHEEWPERTTVVDLSQNGGKAEAVRQGVLSALATGCRFVGYWDADLATPLSAIPQFADVLDRKKSIEIVVGTRIPLLGHSIRRQRKRQWLGRLFANVASFVLGLRLYDTQCGAKLFRVSSRLATAFQEPFLARWIFDVELFARMQASTFDFGAAPLDEILYECPLEHWEDVAGSKLKATDFLRAPAELVEIYWRYLGPFRQPIPLADATTSSGPIIGRIGPTETPVGEGTAEERKAA